ncbi:NADAR family protein [Streptomyces sp. Isolate_45]|uniref:NADAR family protein n=1 Tax=Streptomyces sp. Isolate_45 TaxID=2950111 RepID=UPI002481DEA8|nr:NADAR family protein [Streptomyces sp. Isolate_45]MDA5280001.1 NADAR family protein [Streptomyces sp. Isolate_45]
MIGRRITHRTADGVRIPGTWRHAFIRNGRYFLTDLFIYADGLIDCWGLVTIEEFEEKLRTGWVAATIPDGAEAAAHDLGRWKFSDPRSRLTPELLLAEVLDTIDQLNQRPDSTGRCLAAVDAFLADRTEENRAAAHTAFLAIPASRRRYALGDMDRKDWPLRVLVAGPGGQTYLANDPPVSQESYDRALTYFEERARWSAERGTHVPADGPAAPHAPAVQLCHSYPNKPVVDPGHLGLRNDYPAPISVEEVVYPSVAHAYWALSVTQPDARSAITAADTAAEARKLAAATARLESWEHVRAAVMTSLLRAKYDQHPELAEILLATGDATVIYDDIESAFWGDNAGRGRNWTGRLLELVRSELHMRRIGIPGL